MVDGTYQIELHGPVVQNEDRSGMGITLLKAEFC